MKKMYVPFTSVSVDHEIQRIRDMLISGENLVNDDIGTNGRYTSGENLVVDDIGTNGRYICHCRKCKTSTVIETNKEYVYKSKFFRCCECGYVVGPIVNHLPRTYWYVVHDETNSVEPQKWFGDEKDAIDYVEFCGLSKEQINKIYAWGS